MALKVVHHIKVVGHYVDEKMNSETHFCIFWYASKFEEVSSATNFFVSNIKVLASLALPDPTRKNSERYTVRSRLWLATPDWVLATAIDSIRGGPRGAPSRANIFFGRGFDLENFLNSKIHL